MENLFLSTIDSLAFHDKGMWKHSNCNSKLILKNRERMLSKLQNSQINFDWNGHHKYPHHYEMRLADKLRSHLLGDMCPGAAKRTKLLKKLLDEPGKHTVKLNDVLSKWDTCYECGESLCDLTFDGETIKCVNPCKHPDGAPPWEVTIPCPTGILVFANGFHASRDPHSDCDNGAYGLKHEMEHYAEQGIAYGFCGNTCPGIYINKKNNKLIVQTKHIAMLLCSE